MKQYLLDYDVLLGIAAFCCLCMALQSITAYLYIHLIHEAKKISQTKNRWLRSLAARMEACYRLRIPPKNTKALVQNGIYGYEFMGISLMGWRNLCRQCNGLAVVLSACDIALGIYYSMSRHWFLINGISVFVWLILLLVYGASCQLQRKEEILSCYILDYLENSVMPRLENEYLREEETRAYRQEYFKERASFEDDDTDENAQDEDYGMDGENDYDGDGENVFAASEQEWEDDFEEDNIFAQTKDTKNESGREFDVIDSSVKKKMEREYGQAAGLIQEIVARMAEEEKLNKTPDGEREEGTDEKKLNKVSEGRREERMADREKIMRTAAKRKNAKVSDEEKTDSKTVGEKQTRAVAGKKATSANEKNLRLADGEKIAATREVPAGRDIKRGVRVDMDELLKQVEREKGKSVISSAEQLELLEEVIREYL